MKGLGFMLRRVELMRILFDMSVRFKEIIAKKINQDFESFCVLCSLIAFKKSR
jgi:hypothetical protein